MVKSDAVVPGNNALVGTAAAFGSQISINLGAAFAKQLFPLIGAYGVTALRITPAASSSWLYAVHGGVRFPSIGCPP